VADHRGPLRRRGDADYSVIRTGNFDYQQTRTPDTRITRRIS
jgi:hypothetical protein